MIINNNDFIDLVNDPDIHLEEIEKYNYNDENQRKLLLYRFQHRNQFIDGNSIVQLKVDNKLLEFTKTELNRLLEILSRLYSLQVRTLFQPRPHNLKAASTVSGT